MLWAGAKQLLSLPIVNENRASYQIIMQLETSPENLLRPYHCGTRERQLRLWSLLLSVFIDIFASATENVEVYLRATAGLVCQMVKSALWMILTAYRWLEVEFHL